MIPHTPEQNGVAECTWRTLFDATRAMLKEAKLDNVVGAGNINCCLFKEPKPHKSKLGSSHTT